MTKERLHRYRVLAREREQMERQLETIETTLQSPRVQRLTGMPPTGAGGYDTGELMADYLDLQVTYLRKLAELAREQLAIEEAVGALSPTSRALIRARYLEGRTWHQICEDMSYSWTHVHYLHREALRELKEEELEKCD